VRKSSFHEERTSLILNFAIVTKLLLAELFVLQGFTQKNRREAPQGPLRADRWFANDIGVQDDV
jgi:hypothetical protein